MTTQMSGCPRCRTLRSSITLKTIDQIFRRHVSQAVAAAALAKRSFQISLKFRRDAAVYVAKRAGRSRVELLGPDDTNPLADFETVVRVARRTLDLADPLLAKLRA